MLLHQLPNTAKKKPLLTPQPLEIFRRLHPIHFTTQSHPNQKNSIIQLHELNISIYRWMDGCMYVCMYVCTTYLFFRCPSGEMLLGEAIMCVTSGCPAADAPPNLAMFAYNPLSIVGSKRSIDKVAAHMKTRWT